MPISAVDEIQQVPQAKAWDLDRRRTDSFMLMQFCDLNVFQQLSKAHVWYSRERKIESLQYTFVRFQNIEASGTQASNLFAQLQQLNCQNFRTDCKNMVKATICPSTKHTQAFGVFCFFLR